MKISPRIPALLLLISAILPAAPQKDEEDVSFKVDVSLVTVLVNVKDERGTPIGDLEKDDFTVIDGGSPREIAVFEKRTDRPLSTVRAASSRPRDRSSAPRR